MLVITQSVIRKMPHLPSKAPYNHDLVTDAIAMYAHKNPTESIPSLERARELTVVLVAMLMILLPVHL